MIVRHLLKTFEPFDIGVTLPGVATLVVARVAIVLADEAALKSLGGIRFATLPPVLERGLEIFRPPSDQSGA